MRRHAPYENDEVILYMDEVTGTNVMLQPLSNHHLDKPSRRTSPVTRSSSPRAKSRPAELIETDNDPAKNKPSLYGPEVDDLEPASNGPRENDGNEADDRGTDGGLLPPPRFPGNEADDRGIDSGLLPVPRYPGFAGRYPFDVNIYQQKKTLAQGMMDLALISANANQFRYVLQSKGHPYYLASLAMIGTSLVLQIVVGIGLIWNSTYNVKKNTQVYKANKANNWTVIGIFLVTILNVFISSFGVAEPNSIVIAPLKNCASDSEVDILKDT